MDFFQADPLRCIEKCFQEKVIDINHFWGLVVRVPGYRSRGPGSISGTEGGPLKLVSTTEGLLERKSSGSGLEIENKAVGIRRADHVAPYIHKSWHQLRWREAVARSV
jgi:hypothetical protein